MGRKKQNGFGNPKSLAFKGVESRVYKGKGKGAAGQYPSDRRFGTSVQRTVIEKYDLDSDWTRWRKGFEYYNQGAYLPFTTLTTKLYQGTEDEVSVQFTGERFATKNADSNTHYSIKREVLDNKDLGVVTEVFNNRSLYPENYARNEIWARVESSLLEGSNPNLLRRCTGERVTDGTTAANITNVMTTDRYPAVYTGKVLPSDPATLRVTVPASALNGDDPQSVVNKVLVLRDLIVERSIAEADEFIDASEYFGFSVGVSGGSPVTILEPTATNLPPDLLDIDTLQPLYKTAGNFELDATYVFQKSDYQRFFGRQYLTADVVKGEVGTVSYLVQPLRILGASIEGDELKILSEPFIGSAQLFAKTQVGYLIFNDNSFTTEEPDTYDGEYYHKLGAPDEKLWQRMNTDVDPWMDEVFVSNLNLTFADTYACSCPDFLHAILRMPEASSDGNMTNRQRRIPLPSVQGMSSYKQLGISQAAGTAASWETLEYRSSHRMCKHTTASHFIDRIKVREPKGYPTYEARESFEEKLEKDIQEVAEEFMDQLRRSEITTLEIIAVLAAGLNLNDTELASVIINSNF